MTHGFLVDVISANELDSNYSMEWAASYQGPCQAHDDCPTSQYCDAYRGCDDCAVCRVLFDAFDGGACPDKCFGGVQEGWLSCTALITSQFSPYKAVILGNDEGLGSSSGSGELAVDYTPSFADGPQPCTVCEFEEYPCGDTCLDVFGLVLPACYEGAGCAAGAGRGSLYSLGDAALLLPNASVIKAALALERAGTIDPHYADPQLSETLERVSSTSKCTGVTCPGELQCLQASICNEGICAPHLPKETGLKVRWFLR